jgi:4-amino-4-deoxy-L-arabinose transferase-like glycosyltransferase
LNSLVNYCQTSRYFWPLLAAILLIAFGLALLSSRFSLPYIDHPDEPATYLAAQVWRGQFDLGGYIEGYPPAYVAVQWLAQHLLEGLGLPGLAATVAVLRILACAASAITGLLLARTARRLAGDYAALASAALWASSPLALENSVYAIPDPWAYMLVAAALFTAAVSLTDSARRGACVASFFYGLAAILFKYPLAPALLPGLAATFAWWYRSRDRRIIRLLVWQGLIIALTGFWLLAIYGAGNLGEATVVGQSGCENLLNLGRLLNNLYYTLLPFNVIFWLLIVLLGGLAWLLLGRPPLPLIALLVLLMLGVAIPYVAGVFSLVGLYRLRDVLPASLAACLLFGLAFAMISAWAGQKDKRYSQLALGLLLLALLPHAGQSLALATERHRPDYRTKIRLWADASLVPGLALVDTDNHKVFNPYWSGLSGRLWFGWQQVDSVVLLGQPATQWRTVGGASYLLIAPSLVEDLSRQPAGAAFLETLLHLKTFAGDSAYRGPGAVAYRLWGIDLPSQTALSDADGRIIVYRGRDTVAEPARGQNLDFRFYWQASQQPNANYSLYLHLTPVDTREVLAQADGPPATRPSSTWADPAEMLIGQNYQLSLPVNLPAGQYRLLLGLYDSASNVRLQSANGQDHIEILRFSLP